MAVWIQSYDPFGSWPVSTMAAALPVLVLLWLFRDFSIIYTMTQGGPVRTTQTLSIMTYLQAFSFFRMGYASAIGVVTLVLCTVASLLIVGRRADAIY